MTSWLGFANKLNPEENDPAVEAAEVAFDALDETANQEVSKLLISISSCLYQLE